MQVNAAERHLLSMRDRVHARRGQAVNAGWRLILTVLLVVEPAIAAPLRVQDDKGHALARTLCASCHSVEPSDSDSSFAEVPSFTAIAALPTTTSSGLHAFLSTPHGEMPDVKLTSDEMDAVVDYILSLKEKKQSAGQHSE
jgi:mono/diheme cytochrome c family protein